VLSTMNRFCREPDLLARSLKVAKEILYLLSEVTHRRSELKE